MHRSSETFAALASALAKAQAHLVNPEKSLTATITDGKSRRDRAQFPLRAPIKWPRHRSQDAERTGDRSHSNHSGRSSLPDAELDYPARPFLRRMDRLPLASLFHCGDC